MSLINLFRKPSMNQGQNSLDPVNKLFSQLFSDIQTKIESTIKSTLRNAVRYEIVSGHRFALILLKEPTYCAQCDGFIWGLWGFSCKSCKLISHIKCIPVIRSICVRDPNTRSSETPSNVLRGHSFDKKTFVKPSMCDHCGTLIYSCTKVHQGLQCPECCMKIHYECEDFVCFDCDRTRKSKKIIAKEPTEATTYSFNHLSKIKIEDFEILKLIGTGSYSKVYLARLSRNGGQAEFAIKVIKKTDPVIGSDPQSVISEMVALNLGRRHPFLTIAHCCFQSEDRLYFVMEHVIGRDLFYYTRKNRKLTEDQTRFYAAEIVLALRFLHSENIIHRDLKSENVIIDQNGHCKLIDFGMSKELNKTESGRTRTFCGTPYYISPEIILGRDYGNSVDWWSLGVLMYEMLVGFPPFEADEEEEIYKLIIYGQLDFPRACKLSHEAESILIELLDKEPDNRLGCQILFGCEEAIMEHEFFMFPIGIGAKVHQWTELEEKRIKPPFIPSQEDLINEDSAENDKILTPISRSQLQNISQEEFVEFSFYSDSFEAMTQLEH